MQIASVKPLPPQLPATTQELLSLRKNKSNRTLNDYVEDGYLALAEDETFKAYLYAVYDEQAVEGSLAADNVKAAEMIRDLARVKKIAALEHEKLATISKALGVVLRRYQLSRKERRHTVRGEVVPGDNGD